MKLSLAPAGHGTPPPPTVDDADFRLLVESVSDYAIFLLDPQGLVRSWNAGAQKLKGYTAGEIIGRSFEVFYPPEMIEIGFPAHELREALRVGRFEDEGWRLRKDGSRFWASVVVTALVDADGRHRGFAKVTRDLTERRRHEDLLRQSEERFRLLVEGVRDYAIFMLDPAGHVASWNLGAEITQGYIAEEIIGRHFSVFYPQEKIDSGWPAHELECALRDGRFEDEGWRLRKDGSRFWASVVITALHDGQGNPYGFAKITRDLTDRRRITRLESQERHLHRFIAMLGHELRNPLAPISNAVSIMQLEQPATPRARLTRDILVRQVGQLSRLVDDLLDVGRIVSGKVHLRREPVCLQEVVEEALEAVAPARLARRQRLATDIAPAPVWVLGDQARLVQVFNNLLNNAVKFTPEDGQLWVRLGQGDGDARVSIADNGPGIPPDQLDQVFKLFSQGDNAQAAQGGLGVGLSVVHQMVHNHGGDVSVFSTGEPGQGAEFVIRLPAIDPPA